MNITCRFTYTCKHMYMYMSKHYVHVYVHFHMYMYKYMYVSVRKLTVKVAFTSKQSEDITLQTNTSHAKTGVVYVIHCEYGGTYIRETGQTLKIIMTKHKRAIMLTIQDIISNGSLGFRRLFTKLTKRSHPYS